MTQVEEREATEPADAPRAKETSSGRSRRVVVGALTLLLLLLPLARPWIGQPFNYVMQMGIVVLMWIAMSSSWNLIGGFTGYISLGHNVFYGIGGYASGLMLVYLGWSPFLTAPLSGLIAVAFGFLVGLITLRTRGPSFIISTLALLLMTGLIFDNWDLVGGSNGLSLPLPPFPVETVKIPSTTPCWSSPWGRCTWATGWRTPSSVWHCERSPRTRPRPRWQESTPGE
jgi:branched-chain amino acid transport system permease protein